LELQPKVFVLENVKGMTVGKHKIFIEEIIDKFEKQGYKVRTEYQILNAAQYGVPQNRERLFLIGSRHDFELPNYPKSITKIPKKNKSVLNDKLPSSPTVWEAIQDLPEVEDYVELYKQDWVFTDFGKPSNYARKLRSLGSREDNYLYERKYDPRMLTSSLRTQHTLESIKRFESTPHGTTEPISRFFKLDPEGICNTLRAGTPSNRGAYTSPRPIHPFTPRCITVREAARLHSYPDWFRFHATKWHGFRQIGNSVPPLLAKAVALEIIKALGIEPFYSDIALSLGDVSLVTLDMSRAAKLFGVNPHVIEPRTSFDLKFLPRKESVL
jgi:DNA (cytosine-5)-methyltransferase 1